jgi:hypothetical protein
MSDTLSVRTEAKARIRRKIRGRRRKDMENGKNRDEVKTSGKR